LAPGRGSSYNPSRRWRTKRPRHLQTVPGVTCRRRGDDAVRGALGTGQNDARARATCGADREQWANDSNRCRSSSVRLKVTLGRPVRMVASLQSDTIGPRHLFQFLLLHDTRLAHEHALADLREWRLSKPRAPACAKDGLRVLPGHRLRFTARTCQSCQSSEVSYTTG
jgi:hypothetical protein